jgi:ubiquinone biosynthesis protein UbiJ
MWSEIWVLIPLAAIVGGFITRWQRNAVQLELARGGNVQAIQELRDAVQRLDQRVSNLERAVMTAEEHRKYAL